MQRTTRRGQNYTTAAINEKMKAFFRHERETLVRRPDCELKSWERNEKRAVLAMYPEMRSQQEHAA